MDLALFNRLPLSPHQREYVRACWKEFPQDDQALSIWQRLVKNINQSGVIFMVLIGLLIWRQSIAVGVGITFIWVLGLMVIVAIIYSLRWACSWPVTSKPSSRPPLPWGKFSSWDRFITKKEQLVYLVPRYLSFDAMSALAASIVEEAIPTVASSITNVL